jgi:hypothetical protein
MWKYLSGVWSDIRRREVSAPPVENGQFLPLATQTWITDDLEGL